ncbi:T9SS type A sorting domain-containing protein [Niastella caeni]|uniref:T9SS type A sorting domain-containing protein n=1 Tax=Niastella caeni TaxID=2569763 RepID=A0A4S8HZZ3_9BACT|nr:T9SS type A sorting domain-containing protein [Niastella caeni]THU40439.1 T9SS type A sorting domain-containing protein [Niastella caeni]
MKRMILPVALLLAAAGANGQDVLHNSGNLQVHSGASLCSHAAFTNSSSGALVNNGSLYVKGNLTNDQAAMSAGNGVLYMNGSAAQTVSGTQSFKTYQLVTNNAAGITLNNNLSVANVHTFTNGMIVTSATPNYLVYEAGASYTGDADARHVNGWVKKLGNTDFTFPVGNGTYERTVAVSNLSASSELNARYRSATPNSTSVQSPILLVNTNEYWEINRISGGTAQVTLNWNHSKVAFPNYLLSEVRATYYNTSMWVNEGGSATGTVTTTGSVTSNAVNSFGYFAIGSVGYVLPMHFISVAAQRKTGTTVVRWKTARESNVDRYEVERLNTSGSFSKIGSVKSHNSQDETNYEYIDDLPLVGTAMYRIRSVDRDGQQSYSRIVSVSENNNAASFLVLNNPAHEAIYLSCSAAFKGQYQYELFNTSGQLMQSGTLKINGVDIVTIPLAMKIAPGIYLLNVKNEAFRFAKRILVK